MIVIAPGVLPPPFVPEDSAVIPPEAPLGVSWEWEVPWLGRTWTLTDNASPLLRTLGATTTGRADFEHWWSEAGRIPGSTWEGGRDLRGELFLPLAVQADDALTFLAEHDALQSACDPERESIMRTIRPDGQVREIPCRYVSGAGEIAASSDPLRTGVAPFGITWALADPYWRGVPVEQRFAYEVPPPFFPGPPFAFGSGFSLSEAAITNPGGVPSSAIWLVEGPYTGFSVGIGSALVKMTLTKAAGQWVRIDMTPGVTTFVDELGNDVRDSLTDVAFEPIPPGISPLVTSLTSPGPGAAATLTFTPRYRPAW